MLMKAPVMDAACKPGQEGKGLMQGEQARNGGAGECRWGEQCY